MTGLSSFPGSPTLLLRGWTRLILAEFIAGAIVMVAVGAWITVAASSAGTKVVGIWVLTAGLNYVPLAGHAALLSRPGAVAAAVAGLDAGGELRPYGVRQLWILGPRSLAAVTPRGLA